MRNTKIWLLVRLLLVVFDFLHVLATLSVVIYAMYAQTFNNEAEWLLYGIAMICTRIAIDLIKRHGRKALIEKQRAVNFFTETAPAIRQDYASLSEDVRDQCVVETEFGNHLLIVVKDFNKLHTLMLSVGAKTEGEEFVCSIYLYRARYDGHAQGSAWELRARGDRTIALHEGLFRIRDRFREEVSVATFAEDRLCELMLTHVRRRVKELLAPP